MYVCLLGPRNCGGDKADSRRGGSMAAQLSPDMPQPAMDQFLAAAFGVQTNPFSVKDIFESRKDAVAWGLLRYIMYVPGVCMFPCTPPPQSRGGGMYV